MDLEALLKLLDLKVDLVFMVPDDVAAYVGNYWGLSFACSKDLGIGQAVMADGGDQWRQVPGQRMNDNFAHH